MNRKRQLNLFFSTILVLCMIMQGFLVSVSAADVSEKTDVTITSFDILKKGTQTPAGSVGESDEFDIRFKWDASMYKNTLKKGDYFNITLPDEMKFPSNHSATHFNLTDDAGNIVATAAVSPKETGGGTIKVTFTDYVNNRYNIKGNLYLQASFVKTKIKVDQKNSFVVSINGKKVKKDINITGPGNVGDESLFKYSYAPDNKTDRVRWNVRINFKKMDLKNAVIKDKLNPSSQKYHTNDGTFVLREVEYDEKGNVKNVIKTYSTDELKNTGMLTFNAAQNEFTLKLGNAGKKSYKLTYETTYVEGMVLKNYVELTNLNFHTKVENSFKSASSGGHGQGDLNSKIKIIKIDADNNQTKLKGAVFKITSKADGKSFELTTDSNGEAISEKLIAGQYTIEEVTAPKGFNKNGNKYTVTVTTGGAAIQTVTNERIKTNIEVSKTWVGPKKDSVTVKLFENDKPTNKTLVLKASENYKGKFEELPKYDLDGNEIKYTIKEDVPEGYSENITGNAKTGFIITNTNTEKTEVKVNKKWVGPKKDFVKVKLLADGHEVPGKTLTLNEAGNWEGKFTELKKYNNDGSKIKYTVKEDVPEGYTENIKENSENNFTITNTNIEKISIPVIKKWVGPELSSVVIKLKADGQVKETHTFKADENWSYTFKNLDKYRADGTEIEYTIEEEHVNNYTSSIEKSSTGAGYIVTNTNVEKISICGKKTWDDANNQDGKRPTQITVNLLKNGTKFKSVTVKADANGNWKYEFTNLDKYENKKEIKYTVEEEKVEGYETKVEGYNIKNSYTPEKTEVKGEKTWDDANNQDGKRPTQITVNLLKNGTKFKTVTVKADANGNWKYEFTNLDKYENGQEIKYTVEEEKVEGYETKVEGYNIKNSYTPEKTELKVTKTWDDENDKDKIRPASITVRLYANGKEKESIVLDKSNGWTYAWKSLDKYENGKEIRYTVTEDKVKGYESEIDSSNAKDIKIKNTHKPEKPNEKPKKPDTGDHSDIMMQMIMMIGSLLGIALIARKKIKA